MPASTRSASSPFSSYPKFKGDGDVLPTDCAGVRTKLVPVECGNRISMNRTFLTATETKCPSHQDGTPCNRRSGGGENPQYVLSYYPTGHKSNLMTFIQRSQDPYIGTSEETYAK